MAVTATMLSLNCALWLVRQAAAVYLWGRAANIQTRRLVLRLNSTPPVVRVRG